jgi:hypothetical protein
MKHDCQIGIHAGLPAFFTLEVEEVYRHTQGAHRALAFPDFLTGLGLEAYRKGSAVPPEQEKSPEDPDEKESLPTAEPLHLFDINPAGLPDLFREFDEAMEPPEETPALRLVRAGKGASQAGRNSPDSGFRKYPCPGPAWTSARQGNRRAGSSGT